jgi:hypothetical protein
LGEIDFINTINALAKHYDRFKSLKKEKSSDEFIKRIITIVETYQEWIVEREKWKDLEERLKEIKIQVEELRKSEQI